MSRRFHCHWNSWVKGRQYNLDCTERPKCYYRLYSIRIRYLNRSHIGSIPRIRLESVQYCRVAKRSRSITVLARKCMLHWQSYLTSCCIHVPILCRSRWRWWHIELQINHIVELVKLSHLQPNNWDLRKCSKIHYWRLLDRSLVRCCLHRLLHRKLKRHKLVNIRSLLRFPIKKSKQYDMLKNTTSRLRLTWSLYMQRSLLHCVVFWRIFTFIKIYNNQGPILLTLDQFLE